jgi:hypothetical protein
MSEKETQTTCVLVEQPHRIAEIRYQWFIYCEIAGQPTQTVAQSPQYYSDPQTALTAGKDFCENHIKVRVQASAH